MEEKGYGLYSYLLFGSPPTDTTRERFLKAIEAFLRFPDIENLEKMRLKSKLNVTYLPIKRRPEPEALEKLAGGKDQAYREVAEWLLIYYDYDSAKVMLAGLREELQEGPYFLSFLKPYDWKKEPSPPYLYQNLSWVPPDLVSLWVSEFLNQAAQERFWEERTGIQLALKVRAIIGVAAKALPDVQRSITELILWKKSVLQ